MAYARKICRTQRFETMLCRTANPPRPPKDAADFSYSPAAAVQNESKLNGDQGLGTHHASSFEASAAPSKLNAMRQEVFKAQHTDFWVTYMAARPKYPPALFDQIFEYHARKGGSRGLAHDLATGPGQVAFRLAQRFDKVVGSDITSSAVEYAQSATCGHQPNASFVVAPAGTIDQHAAPASVDMVTIGEAIPIFDVPVVLQSIAKVLKPGGTLAFWFYCRPVFLATDGKDFDPACNDAYIHLINDLFRRTLLADTGSSQMTFLQASWNHQCSWLDSIALPSEDFTAVERHKWNPDLDLVFCDPQAIGLKETWTSCVRANDQCLNRTDRAFWTTEWNVEDVKRWLMTTMASMHSTDWGSEENAPLVRDLENAFGGPHVKRRAVWPAVLVLATKR